jgi:hypothetical protein
LLSSVLEFPDSHAEYFLPSANGTWKFSRTAIARETTSGAAAAIWFPHDVEPLEKAIAWSLSSYETFRELARETNSGVSFIEINQLSRTGDLAIPSWAKNLGARRLAVSELPPNFVSGFALTAPLTDTNRYLDYLRERCQNRRGTIVQKHLRDFRRIPHAFDVMITALELARVTCLVIAIWNRIVVRS